MPVEKQSRPASENDGLPPLPPGGKERMLVVDDERAMQTISQMQLTMLGYDTTTVSSGEEAVALFESAKKANNPPPFDLVLMDMTMKGLDGISASKAIHNLYPGQKIVIVSGYTRETLEKKLGPLLFSWLTKPYTVDELAACIRTALAACRT